MKVQNSLHVYDRNEKPPIPEGLRTDFEVLSPYGFKIIERDGKKMWAVATKEEYRAGIAQLRGVSPDEVDDTGDCYCTSPHKCTEFCDLSGDSGMCELIYNPANSHYFCECFPI